MRLIDNLEELKVDDYISCLESRGERTTYKIVGVNDKVLQIEIMEEYKRGWDGEFSTSYSNDTRNIIFKKKRKIKKKKLKHKVVTYNDDWNIFKLTEKERIKVIREKILESLK